MPKRSFNTIAELIIALGAIVTVVGLAYPSVPTWVMRVGLVTVILPALGWALGNAARPRFGGIGRSWNGPDLRYIHPVWRWVPFLFGPPFRLLIRLLLAWHSRVFLVCLVGAILSFAPMLWIHDWNGLITGIRTRSIGWGLLIFGARFLTILLTAALAIGLGYVTRPTKHEEDLADDVIAALARYVPQGKIAPKLWADAVESDRGPVRIVAVNAADLLEPIDESGKSVLDAAWERCPDQRFQVLMHDPTSQVLRRWSFWTNGKYCESYAVDFMRFMLRYEDEYSRGNDPRMVVRVTQERLRYRMLITPVRVVVQIYGASRILLGATRVTRQERPLQAFRIYRMEDTEELQRCAHLVSTVATGDNLTTSGAATKVKSCALATLPTVTNWSNRVVRKEPGDSIYRHFESKFNAEWQDTTEARGGVEGPLSTWREPKLRELARMCHVPKEQLSPGKSKEEVIEAIRKALGL